MAKNRLEILAKTDIIVTAPEKSAFRIELQYGLDGQPTEIVVAGMYWTDGTWQYSKNQFRTICTLETARALMDGVKAAFDHSKKVDKKPKASPVENVLEKMTDDEKAALIAKLMADMKKHEDAKTAGAKTAADVQELVLASAISAPRRGRPAKK